MASYEKRKKELQDALKLLETDLPTEDTFLDKAIEEYFKARDEVLTDLLELAGDLSDNPRASDWANKLNRGKEVLKNTLETALRYVTVPSAGGLAFQQMAFNYENTFWKSLEALDIGTRRDALMIMRKDLRAYHDDLKVKWEKITSENRPLLEESRKAIKELVDYVDKSIGQTAPIFKQLQVFAGDFNMDFKELLKIVKDKARELAGKTFGEFVIQAMRAYLNRQQGKAKQAVSILQRILDEMSALKDEYEQHINYYRDRVISEVRVLTAVPQSRRVTDEFLKKGGVDPAKEKYMELTRLVERWGTDLPTNGLKDDAKEFGKAVTDKLFGHIVEMEKSFKDFVDQHKGRLFGELAREVEVEMVDDRYAEDFASALAGRGLETKLREWNSDGRRLLELDLEDTFRAFEDTLEDQPEELQKEVRAYVGAFKNELNRDMEEWVKKIQSSSDEVLAIYGIDKFRTNFERRKLLDVLRGN